MSSVTPFPSANVARRSDQRGAGGYRPLRCVGEVALPTPLVTDVARLLDTEGDVDRWSCRSLQHPDGGSPESVFEVERTTGLERIRVMENGPAEPQHAGHRDADGTPVRFMFRADVDAVRLENAQLILPHATWRVSLDDRIRLLAVLDEEGSVTLGECLAIFRNTSRPIAAVASLALAHVVDLDLDTPLGSRSRVIRRPD